MTDDPGDLCIASDCRRLDGESVSRAPADTIASIWARVSAGVAAKGVFMTISLEALSTSCVPDKCYVAMTCVAKHYTNDKHRSFWRNAKGGTVSGAGRATM
jgi:hypothetical protein